jgi:hypothetical protein
MTNFERLCNKDNLMQHLINVTDCINCPCRRDGCFPILNGHQDYEKCADVIAEWLAEEEWSEGGCDGRA